MILLFQYLAVIGSAVVGLLVLAGQRRSVASFTFVASLVLLALEGVFAARALNVVTPSEIVYWGHLRLAATACLPGIWLALSLTYARGNHREFLARNRVLIAAAFVAPLILWLGFPNALVTGADLNAASFDWLLRLGWAGLGINVVVILFAILSLANFERTFWTSVGTARWRIKYTILGLAVLLTTRIYTSAQALIYNSMNLTLEGVNAGALTLACLLIGISLFRPSSFHVDVYPSQAVLGKSLSALLVGAYLLTVGGLAKAVRELGGRDFLPLSAFLILLAFTGLAALLFSERLRQRVRRFVSRQFRRPLHDYRALWLAFTERTTLQVDREGLCRAVAKSVSELFQALSVTLWLVEDGEKHWTFSASTSLTAEVANKLTEPDTDWRPTFELLRQRGSPLDLEASDTPALVAIKRLQPTQFSNGGARICVPLAANQRFLGMILLGDRVSGAAYVDEDFELLRCIGDQVSSHLLNLELSAKLIEAKEMQAFQTMSAFLVHDLKNTASTLSLILQNLSAHFGDPNFKQDALQAVRRGVDHINELIGRLTSLRQRLEIQPRECDLNEVVKAARSSVGEVQEVKLVEDLQPLPRCLLDADQVRKVLVNLILNAREAVGRAGEIRMQTGRQNGWIFFSVQDNGCGMTPEFLKRSLFKPFQTTKKHGVGIGMMQSKMIIEAHAGRIRVESEPGKGTLVSVFLPLQPKSK